MSGQFSSEEDNANIKRMWTGNDPFGWSYGDYNGGAETLPNGTMVVLSNKFYNSGIPLPTDLVNGDTVKICGFVRAKQKADRPNHTFYVTVSSFNCEQLYKGQSSSITPSTVIPVADYPFDRTICFSESVILSGILPGCTTYLLVGMNTAWDSPIASYDYQFSYTLDATKACGAGNLFIRNCCDPEYYEIIANNNVAVGSSFSDVDGNCWSVEYVTTLNITGIRSLSTTYTGCTACIANNTCPENFVVKSCCSLDEQTFTAALVGVTVGGTFVDTFGFCWDVVGTTPLPITNVVFVGTVYSVESCEYCESENNCPVVLEIKSCCRPGIVGWTTEGILGQTLAVGDSFVDTFGVCWSVIARGTDLIISFPTLNFLDWSATYSPDSLCEDCIIANACPATLYYTVQNCCTEEVEIVELDWGPSVGESYGLLHSTGIGCYEVLSWSDTGTPTLTSASREGGYRECRECLENFMNGYCPGLTQCCYEYQQRDTPNITGYLCDGTFVSETSIGNGICMSYVIRPDAYSNVGPCCFTIYNPSTTVTINIDVTDCNGNRSITTLLPETESNCLSCVNSSDGPWTIGTTPCT
jgi:hypothetical protein